MKKVVRWSDERGKAGDRNKKISQIFSGIRELLVYSKFENFSKFFLKVTKSGYFLKKKFYLKFLTKN